MTCSGMCPGMSAARSPADSRTSASCKESIASCGRGAARTGQDRFELRTWQRRQFLQRTAYLGVVERQQEAVDGLDRLLMARRAVAIAQHHLGQVVGDVAADEFVDHRRQFTLAAVLH